MKKFLLVLLALMLSSVSAKTTFPDLPKLSTAQLKHLLTNKVIYVNHLTQFQQGGIFTGGPAEIVAFYQDGTQRGLLLYPPGNNRQMDSGTWQLKNDLLCASWKHWQQGKQHCLYWFKSRHHYFIFDTLGQLHGVIYKKNIR